MHPRTKFMIGGVTGIQSLLPVMLTEGVHRRGLRLAALARLVEFEAAQDPEVDRVVAAIIADVRRRGDAALVEYTARFDGHTVATAADLAIGADAMRAAHDGLPEPLRAALAVAARRIRTFHAAASSCSATPTAASSASG